MKKIIILFDDLAGVRQSAQLRAYQENPGILARVVSSQEGAAPQTGTPEPKCHHQCERGAEGD